MAKKKYKVDIFSNKSLGQLKRHLNEYKNSLPGKLELVCQRLSAIGVEVAKISIVELDAVFTGALYNSIESRRLLATDTKAIYSIVANNKYAIFVEFGTGVVGKESPYIGDLPSDYVYASGKTIREISDGRIGWFYERDGQWYFTEGMPSRPFMYFASMEMRSKVVKIVKEVFR